jgi:hypothetical protein
MWLKFENDTEHLVEELSIRRPLRLTPFHYFVIFPQNISVFPFFPFFPSFSQFQVMLLPSVPWSVKCGTIVSSMAFGVGVV